MTSIEQNRIYQKRHREKYPEKFLERSRKWNKENPERRLYGKAKYRAKKLGKDFNIELSDVVIPEFCPVLKIPLFKGKGKVCDNSPSLDRINQLDGYVKGNVAVISYKANRLKSDLTLEQLNSLVNYMQRKD